MAPPEGFPAKLTGDLTWETANYRDSPDSYVVKLSSGDISEIENALSSFNSAPILNLCLVAIIC